MTPRSLIRDRTRACHATVDSLFSRFTLALPTGYQSLLVAQARAYPSIENALDMAGAASILADWRGRRRSDFLLADLADLHIPAPPTIAPPIFDDESKILGGIYVLEGSRLGGAILAKQIPSSAPRQFLTAPTVAGAWRAFLTLLDARLDHEPALAAAIETAKACFRCFETAGRLELEPTVA